jgi:UDP-N-acetylmuramoyl-tripeptide--D-alanyl-D-alanine ligase
VKFSADDIVAATGGDPHDVQAFAARVGIVTDSRALSPGDAFLALRGERFDGHDFVNEAIARGAALAIVDDASFRPDGFPAIVVADTKAAYLALAALARGRFLGPVLGITGSAGKTTTKQFVTHLVRARFGDRIAATPANENNEIGVAKLLLRASGDEHDALIVEMGARHVNDIAVLVGVARPDVGILTNVGDAHLEIAGSREALADMKWALFGRGARAVLNAADAVSRRRASALEKPPHWFFAEPNQPPVDQCATLTGLVGRCELFGARNGSVAFRLAVDVSVAADYNLANAAAAAAGALELGVPAEAIAAQMATLELPPGRYQSFAMPGGWRIIYDAYNANAGGMIAALDALGGEHAERAVAVLGSMAELGDESVQLHELVGAHAARRAGVVLVAGEYAGELERGAQRAGMSKDAVVRVESNADAARWLRRHVRPGDVVLLKASRKYRLEEILEELRA